MNYTSAKQRAYDSRRADDCADANTEIGCDEDLNCHAESSLECYRFVQDDFRGCEYKDHGKCSNCFVLWERQP